MAIIREAPALKSKGSLEAVQNLRLPIRDLVGARSNELGLSRSELASRCGFTNINKGLRRIELLFAGELYTASSKTILGALPAALQLNKEIIDSAVRASVDLLVEENRRVARAQDAGWRASFKVHGYLLGETRPTQIVLFGMTGGAERWLKIQLDLSKPPITFARQALAVVRRTPHVPFHGKAIGFVINFAPDHAVRFDLAGNPVAVLPSAYAPGHTEIAIGGRKIDATGRPIFFT